MLQNPLQRLLAARPKKSVRRQRRLLQLTCDHHQSWAISSAFPPPLLRFHLTSATLVTQPSPHPPLHPGHPHWPHTIYVVPEQTGQMKRDEGTLALGHLLYWVVMGRLSCAGLAVSLLNPEPFSCPGPAAGIWEDLSRITGGAKCLCSEVWLLEGLAIMLMSRCVRELSQRVWV